MQEAAGSHYGATKAAKTGKPGLPLPSKRGNSLNPNRMKTSCGVDFVEGTKPGVGGRVETPEGTAGDSTAFSKRSNATGGRFDDPADSGLIQRPNTEFLPSASQEFGEKVKQGRLRPSRSKKAQSGQ